MTPFGDEDADGVCHRHKALTSASAIRVVEQKRATGAAAPSAGGGGDALFARVSAFYISSPSSQLDTSLSRLVRPGLWRDIRAGAAVTG